MSKGSFTHGPFYDRAINDPYMAEAGPFKSGKEFHDWASSLYERRVPDPENILDPYRKDLPDDSEIMFAHEDLYRSNVFLSSTDITKMVGLVDWEQSVWLQLYWENRKTSYACDSFFSEWSEKYPPMITDEHKGTWEAWNYYIKSLGC